MKNLEMLSLVARGLGRLKDEVVFVGGATIELYLPSQLRLKIKTTDVSGKKFQSFEEDGVKSFPQRGMR